jgi:hypothetical protein
MAADRKDKSALARDSVTLKPPLSYLERYSGRTSFGHVLPAADSRLGSTSVEGLILQGDLLKKTISFQHPNGDDDLFDAIDVAISLRIFCPGLYPKYRLYQQFQLFLLFVDRGTTFELPFIAVLPPTFVQRFSVDKKGALMFKQLNADCLYPVPGYNRAPLDNVRLSAPALWNAYYVEVVRFYRRLIEKAYDYFAFPVF